MPLGGGQGCVSGSNVGRVRVGCGPSAQVPPTPRESPGGGIAQARGDPGSGQEGKRRASWVGPGLLRTCRESSGWCLSLSAAIFVLMERETRNIIPIPAFL